MKRQTHNVDPFSATDPVMPWEEPGQGFVPLGSSASEHTPPPSQNHTDNTYSRRATRSKSAKKSRSDNTSSRRATRSKPAKQSRTDNTSSRRETRSKTAERKKDVSLRGCAVELFILAAIIFLVASVTTCNTTTDNSDKHVSTSSSVISSGSEISSDATNTSGKLDSGTYESVRKELIRQEKEESQAISNDISSADEEYVALAASGLDATFSSYSGGATLADAGIDSSELARWFLTNTTFTFSDDYFFASGASDDETAWTGTGYFGMDMPNSDDVIWELVQYLSDITDDTSQDTPLAAQDQELMRAKLESLKGEVERSEFNLMIEFVGSCNPDGSDATVTLNKDSWHAAFLRRFGVYSLTSA